MRLLAKHLLKQQMYYEAVDDIRWINRLSDRRFLRRRPGQRLAGRHLAGQHCYLSCRCPHALVGSDVDSQLAGGPARTALTQSSRGAVNRARSEPPMKPNADAREEERPVLTEAKPTPAALWQRYHASGPGNCDEEELVKSYLP